MSKHKIFAIILLLALVGVGYFNYSTEIHKPGTVSHFPFKFGLDLVGGTELVYKADTSKLASGDVGGAMASLKDVIEKRVNVFGVSEPLVQTESSGVISGNKDERLIVELPGVSDSEKAKAFIGQTPTLEFKLQKDNADQILKNNPNATQDDLFTTTGITGRYLDRASLEFNPTTQEPIVSLTFNSEGKDLFARLTKDNIGKVLAIFLDGRVLSAPVIRDEIINGKAQITGSFGADEAKLLVRNLNYGALPVPITLATSQTIGASLGQEALNSGVKAGLWGFLALSLFLILWYRLPGIVATVSLIMYIMFSLALFKLIPVTLTAAGLAGFILSIGMAVDANVLIFERMKEELRKGRSIFDSLHEGFTRAWLSIRDSNTSSIITAIVLFWLGTSAVKGFALTLGVGVMVSMFTAITVSRTFLFAIAPKNDSKLKKFLFSNGFHKG